MDSEPGRIVKYKGEKDSELPPINLYTDCEVRSPQFADRRYVKDYLGVERTGEPRYMRISDLAKKTGSSPSYIKKLIDGNRIPEAFRAYKDERDTNGRTLIPDRRCIIPTGRTNHGDDEDMKVADYLFRLYEVPQAWVDNPKVRPEPGVILVGDESVPLGERIEATFGLPVGEPPDGEIRSRPRVSSDAEKRQQLEFLLEEIERDLVDLRSEDRWQHYIKVDLDSLPEAILTMFEQDEEMKRKYFEADRNLIIQRKTEEVARLRERIDAIPDSVNPLIRRDRATLRRYGIDLNELEKHPEITGVVVYFRDTDERSVRDIDGVDVISVER